MTEPSPERGERIAKWLARAGVASRRDAEKLLAEGVVQMDGAVVTHPATFVGPDSIVQVRGAVVDAPDRTRLWRYHKPEGLMTTHKDPQGRPTVFDTLPPALPRVVSVGRLDLNTEGLLLFTSSGELANKLMHPRFGLEREYAVRVLGALSAEEKQRLLEGVPLEDGMASFGSVEDGGGEGATPLGNHPQTPWGVPTIGYRTRKKRKGSDRYIVRGRRRGKKGGR